MALCDLCLLVFTPCGVGPSHIVLGLRGQRTTVVQGGSDSVSLLRLGYKTLWRLSWLLSGGASQRLHGEGTQPTQKAVW